MKTIRWGMIGAGDVTEVKSGPGFYTANNSALVAVMRRDGKLAADYAQRHGVARWYDDADALINDPEVDAVYIATPTYAHKEYTLKAAAAGKPVYVEKPMAMNFAECQEMIQACKDADVPLWVAYYRRSLPRFLKIKELIDTGAIGEVRSVMVALYRPPTPSEMNPDTLHWRVLPEYARGGNCIDVGVHTFDLLDYMLGPIKAVQGVALNQGGYYPAEDHIAGVFQHESGAITTGVWCFNSAHHTDMTDIIGTKGKISFATFDNTYLILTNADGVQEFHIDNPPHIQQPIIQSIVEELNGVGACPSTGESGARATWVTDQLLKDRYQD
jgi:predicted dehydrogenase